MASLNNYALSTVRFSHDGTGGKASKFNPFVEYRSGVTHVPEWDFGSAGSANSLKPKVAADNVAGSGSVEVLDWAVTKLNLAAQGLKKVSLGEKLRADEVRLEGNVLTQTALDIVLSDIDSNVYTPNKLGLFKLPTGVGVNTGTTSATKYDSLQNKNCDVIHSGTHEANAALDSNCFAIEVDATIAGASGIGNFTIPSPNTNYQLTWHEVGNPSNNSGGVVHVQAASHTINFGGSGKYRVYIDPVDVPSGSNNFTQFQFLNSGDKNKLIHVLQWGVAAWSTFFEAYFGCVNLLTTAYADTPDLSEGPSLYRMFRSAALLNPDTSGWNTSSVTNMAEMFRGATSANPDTSNWDVSSVTEMASIFNAATAANPDVSGWDVSSVTNMVAMFVNASSANPDLSNWDTSSVTLIASMFTNATSFVGNGLSRLEVSAVTDATSFLLGTGVSTVNYNALLISWSQQSVQSNVPFHAGSTQYTSGASAARDTLINTYGWVITDGGLAS